MVLKALEVLHSAELTTVSPLWHLVEKKQFHHLHNSAFLLPSTRYRTTAPPFLRAVRQYSQSVD